MFRISKLTDYATLLLTTMARDPETVYSAQQLADLNRLEAPTASKVLKMLAAADLVRSYRGAYGGYRLARPPAGISVAAVLRAMEGSVGITECVADPGACSQEDHCRLRGNWWRIGQAIERALEDLTLAEMIAPVDFPPPRLAVAIAIVGGAAG